MRVGCGAVCGCGMLSVQKKTDDRSLRWLNPHNCQQMSIRWQAVQHEKKVSMSCITIPQWWKRNPKVSYGGLQTSKTTIEVAYTHRQILLDMVWRDNVRE